jgi:hypothetical protein
MISTRARIRLASTISAFLVLAVPLSAADDSERLLTVDHYVNVKSRSTSAKKCSPVRLCAARR